MENPFQESRSHLTNHDLEAEDDLGLSGLTDVGSTWFTNVSQDLEKLVQKWTHALQTFFVDNPCEVHHPSWPVRCRLC